MVPVVIFLFKCWSSKWRKAKTWISVLLRVSLKPRATFPILSRDLCHQKTLGHGWFLKRTMAEKNGESTPRKKKTQKPQERQASNKTSLAASRPPTLGGGASPNSGLPHRQGGWKMYPGLSQDLRTPRKNQLPRCSWLRLSMEDPIPALDTPEVVGVSKHRLFEGPTTIGSLWVGSKLDTPKTSRE